MKQHKKKNKNLKAGRMSVLLLSIMLFVAGCQDSASMTLTKDGTAVTDAPSEAQSTEGDPEDTVSESVPDEYQGEGDPEDTESQSVPEDGSISSDDGSHLSDDGSTITPDIPEVSEGDPEDTESIRVPQTDTSGEGDAEETDISKGNGNSPRDIYVYVCGEVEHSGVVKLAKDARVFEALEAAGGLKETAALKAVNQAKILEDGMMIVIPSQEEYTQACEEGRTLQVFVEASGKNAQEENQLNENTFLENLTEENTGKKININTADAVELKAIPGVGDAKAEAILKYRETNGKFQSVEEITNVSGIKESTFEKIKDYITVS